MRVWLKVEKPVNMALVQSLRLVLDSGEAEAISLANDRGIRVILDDYKARSIAMGMGLKVIGTIGCAIIAKQAGVIPLLRPLLEGLDATGFYLDASLKDEALCRRRVVAWPRAVFYSIRARFTRPGNH